MISTTPANLNEQYREFWQQRKVRIDELLEISDIVRIAASREIKKAAYVALATSEADRIERLRHQTIFEIELENIDEEYGPQLRAIHARRASARMPRGKLVDGKSVSDIVIEILSKPEIASLNEWAAWDALPSAFALFGITLIAGPTQNDPTKDKYSYSFRRGTKTLGRGHFRSLRTKSRKNMIQISDLI